MHVWQAVLYLAAILLIGLAAFGVGAPRVSLALLGAAVFVLAFALPVIAAL
jgi:hypothetical protein